MKRLPRFLESVAVTTSNDNASPSRKERERAVRRHAMLTAAGQVFAEKGFRIATVEEIAIRAEFGKGTIYNYFPGGKDEILIAILDTIFDHFQERSQSILQDPGGATLRVRIGQLLSEFLAYFSENHDLFIILLKEGNRIMFGDDLEASVHLFRRESEVTQSLVPAIQAAMKAGEIRPVHAHTMAHLISGQVESLMRCQCLSEMSEMHEMPHAFTGLDGDPEEAVEMLTSLIFDGIAAPDFKQKEV